MVKKGLAGGFLGLTLRTRLKPRRGYCHESKKGSTWKMTREKLKYDFAIRINCNTKRLCFV